MPITFVFVLTDVENGAMYVPITFVFVLTDVENTAMYAPITSVVVLTDVENTAMYASITSVVVLTDVENTAMYASITSVVVLTDVENTAMYVPITSVIVLTDVENTAMCVCMCLLFDDHGVFNFNKLRRPTYVGIVPFVDGEVVVGSDGCDGGAGDSRVRVGSHVHHGRVGQKLHDHAHILLVLGKHHWALKATNQTSFK